MSRIFTTSDTHFSHKNIIQYCERPFKDVCKMNDVLITNWNFVVGPNDIIIHVGDFGLGPVLQLQDICSQLNGYKILIKGNHDRNASTMKQIGFNEIHNMWNLNVDEKVFHFQHYPPQPKDVFPYCDYFIYGHTHNHSGSNHPKTLNVCVENTNYTPIPLEVSTLSKLLLEQHSKKD